MYKRNTRHVEAQVSAQRFHLRPLWWASHMSFTLLSFALHHRQAARSHFTHSHGQTVCVTPLDVVRDGGPLEDLLLRAALALTKPSLLPASGPGRWWHPKEVTREGCIALS